VAVIAESVLSL